MARRFLLIEFDDATQADKLKSQIDEATRRGRGYRVVGLFARPGNDYCLCGTWTTGRNRNTSLKRGEKFGWWVCTTCKKPAPMMVGLKNLVKPEDIINPVFTEDTKLSFYTYALSADTTTSAKMREANGLA